MTERVFCSALAAAADAPLCGTAVPVDIWLLIEYPRPWKPKALEDNDLVEASRKHILALPDKVAELTGKKLRVQFIKQASSADVEFPRVMLAAYGELALVELKNYSAIAELDIAAIARGELPGGKRVDKSIFLVCTNGQRDVCCARFGLPLFEQMRLDIEDRVWQTTHIGGHRYAPNLVCLPSGLVYGFVAPDEALDVVTQTDSDQVILSKLRGRASLPEVAQAAEYFARVALERTQNDDVKLIDMTQADTEVSVELALGSKRVRVVLRQFKGAEPVLASCGAEPKRIDEFELVSVNTSSMS